MIKRNFVNTAAFLLNLNSSKKVPTVIIALSSTVNEPKEAGVSKMGRLQTFVKVSNLLFCMMQTCKCNHYICSELCEIWENKH